MVTVAISRTWSVKFCAIPLTEQHQYTNPLGHDPTKPTIFCELSPDATDAGHGGLSAKATLRPDLLRQMRDLTCKHLQLIYHLVDGMLEPRNLWILLCGMYQDLLAQISMCHGRDDRADLLEYFLIGCVDLCILLDFALQLFNRGRVAEGIQRVLGSGLLVRQLRVDALDRISLTLNLGGLLLHVLS